MKVAILGAMPQEITAYKELQGADSRIVHVGFTGVGKPAAAGVTQEVISRFRPDYLLFTGVAGALAPELEIGDIGIVTAAIDAEMDARGWNPELKLGEQPYSGNRIYRSF